ncbi:MAG: CDP-alcohol phosphatidyltransferase family protein [Bacteroidia bacterium]|nr:MAG: CDP-alcohol phosphatidyltransferase family protein [Bacteroidia bacterium]
MKKEYLTAPNLLSLYRIIVFPLILWFILANNETLFAIFLIINLITDILDGLIARLLKMQTELGAKLDSTGDIGTYILAFIGIFVFKWDVIAPHILPFLVFAGLCIVLVILAWIKFGKVPSFHLYSWKVGGYIQGFFFFTLFAFDFYPVLYYFMTFWSIFAALEHIIIQLIIPQMRSNVKGLYWVLRDHQKRKGQ